MLVCHCHRVCDRTIRECARQGASSAEDVGAACGAGTACGGCQPLIETLVKSELTRGSEAPCAHEAPHRSLVMAAEENRAA